MINLGKIYDNLDKMASMKRYKCATPGYFPSVGEINTFARSDEFPHMLPYLLWLDECLTDEEDRKKHKEAIAALRDIVSDMDEEDDWEDEVEEDEDWAEEEMGEEEAEKEDASFFDKGCY